ncbi:hypothetical protein ACLOJK_010397 [Asimina triloba]
MEVDQVNLQTKRLWMSIECSAPVKQMFMCSGALDRWTVGIRPAHPSPSPTLALCECVRRPCIPLSLPTLSAVSARSTAQDAPRCTGVAVGQSSARVKVEGHCLSYRDSSLVLLDSIHIKTPT